MRLLRRFPARRYELAFCSVVLVGCCVLISLVREMKDVAWMLTLITLELILPASMGLVSGGLLAGDPVLELILTLHQPAWRILAERASILFGLAAGFGAVLLLLAEKWGIFLPKDSTDRMFIWLSPLVAFVGLANAAALVRGRSLDGAIAVAGVLGFSLLALLRIPRLCASLPKDVPCHWWLTSPLMTLGNATDPAWPLNRLVWLGMGIGLLAASFSLAGREEPLLPRGPSE